MKYNEELRKYREEIMSEIYDTYENTLEKYGDFEVPVPTYEMYKYRDIDFSVIVSLLLRSKINKKEDNYRYVVYSNIDKDKICKECKISRLTLQRRLKYFEEKNILKYKNTDKGLIYIINYSLNDKYYVTVHHRILKNLLKYTNREAIKIYILLKVQCDILNNSKSMSNSYICSLLGYSTKCHRNLHKIGSITNLLAKYGFIEKVQKRIYGTNENGKSNIKYVDTYYKINSLEVWDKKIMDVL